MTYKEQALAVRITDARTPPRSGPNWSPLTVLDVIDRLHAELRELAEYRTRRDFWPAWLCIHCGENRNEKNRGMCEECAYRPEDRHMCWAGHCSRMCCACLCGEVDK